jgi:hypothetical protein
VKLLYYKQLLMRNGIEMESKCGAVGGAERFRFPDPGDDMMDFTALSVPATLAKLSKQQNRR